MGDSGGSSMMNVGGGGEEEGGKAATTTTTKPKPMVDDSPIMRGDAAAKAADMANYFISYAYLYHQKQMLTDHRRMEAYHAAIVGNAQAFQGRTVVDVGTGTGVLAVWSAKAGASKVLAVEYTDMAKHARTIVSRNGVANVVQVIQGSAEELAGLAEQSVDIIVSEWMGYMLLRESMLDSLIRVRNKYLKPEGGHMFPSHATMFWALVNDEAERSAREREYHDAMYDWHSFAHETRARYDLDMTALSKQYEDEQKEYFLLSSYWAELRGDQVVGTPAQIYHLDLKHCTFEDVKGVPPTPFAFTIAPPDDNGEYYQQGDQSQGQAGGGPVRVSGFAGWFTTDFFGNDPQNPLPHPTTLSTAPEVGYTHWGQQVFHLLEPLDLQPGDRVEGTVAMGRQTENPRLYEVEVSYSVIPAMGGDQAGVPAVVTHKYQVP